MAAEAARGVSPKTWNDSLKLLRATFKHLHSHLTDGMNPFHGLVRTGAWFGGRHGGPGFQPLIGFADVCPGRCPGLVWAAPLALADGSSATRAASRFAVVAREAANCVLIHPSHPLVRFRHEPGLFGEGHPGSYRPPSVSIAS